MKTTSVILVKKIFEKAFLFAALSFLIATAILLLPSSCNALKYPVRDAIAIDGDTANLTIIYRIEVPFPGDKPALTMIWTDIRVRLDGVNTPESFRPKCSREKVLGERAKRWLDSRLRKAQSIELITKNRERDKFGRVLGTLIADGYNLNQGLIDEGLADPYSGGRRDPMRWCLDAEPS